MQRFTPITSQAILLLENNIDTDQIIPARFLKGIQKAGLGTNLFANWRYHEDGSTNPDCVLNLPQASRAQILITGDNFGCGSSREHAVWALTDFGIRAVVSTSFADIFRNNALRNGLLTIQVQLDELDILVETLTRHPGILFTVDLESQTLSFTEGAFNVETAPAESVIQLIQFPVDPFAKKCLLQGTDELGYLLNLESKISQYEQLRGIPNPGGVI